jgi:hypothetical protein
MASKIRINNEEALGYLRELSQYLTVGSCAARECLDEALARLKADRPDLREKVEKVISSFRTAANDCTP